jgi:hypothetical protein
MNDLTAAWIATQAALPAEWTLDGLRCTSTGLSSHERDDGWRAVAVRTDGLSAEATSDDPLDALRSLLLTLPE